MSNIWISYKAMQVMHNNIISLLLSSLKKATGITLKITGMALFQLSHNF